MSKELDDKGMKKLPLCHSCSKVAVWLVTAQSGVVGLGPALWKMCTEHAKGFKNKRALRSTDY